MATCLERFSNCESCERYGSKDLIRPFESCSWRLTSAISVSKDGSLNHLMRDGSICLTFELRPRPVRAVAPAANLQTQELGPLKWPPGKTPSNNIIRSPLNFYRAPG